MAEAWLFTASSPLNDFLQYQHSTTGFFFFPILVRTFKWKGKGKLFARIGAQVYGTVE